MLRPMKRPDINVNDYPNHKLDLQYSKISETCKLDIFYPNGKGPFPFIISIHGGAFKGGDKRGEEMIAPMLKGLNKNIAVVGVNYRLSKEAKFPAAIVDIKDALVYLKKNAQELNLDPNKIIIWGGSAGAYLSIMGGMLNKLPFIDKDGDLNVSGVIAWFPPINFATMNEHLHFANLYTEKHDHDNENSPESLFLGYCVKDNREKLQISNPETYLDDKMCPMYLQHGSIDHIVPCQQSKDFYAKSSKLNNNIIFEVIEDADHGDRKFETEENLDKMFEFINKCFK